MDAIGEQSLALFATDTAVAEPDLSTLVRDYSGLLYRVALSLLRNAAEAEDVVQDVFLRVLQRQGELNRIAEIRPWLVRIAWNLAIDRTRKRRPDQIDEMFAGFGRALDDKIRVIRDQLAEAEALRKEAEALKSEYEKKAKSVDKDRKALMERAKHEGQAREDSVRDQKHHARREVPRNLRSRLQNLPVLHECDERGHGEQDEEPHQLFLRSTTCGNGRHRKLRLLKFYLGRKDLGVKLP